ncbi:MAG TPA: hypothetical protein ENK18_20420 [Deltaproteobacteria bacterium]|nr:hypothetical protein [Deltaproteobacteria bacterium]
MADLDRALLASWVVVPVLDLWFALQGFVAPSPLQIVLEILLPGLLMINHLHFSRGRAPWLGSTLWPAGLTLWLQLVALSPGGMGHRLVFGLGVAVCVVAGVRGSWWLGALPRWPGRPGRWRWGGVLASIGAVILGRYAVLSWSDGGRGAVAKPALALLEELLPLRASGAGSSGPPIVLITVDTMRWDHLVRTRSWARLAARGRRWERAMSTSSWTLPAMASLYTGLEPGGHGANARVNGGYQAIEPSAPRLPVELGEQGYTTAAVFSNAWLLDTLGFRRGFHRYWHLNHDRSHRLVFAGVPSVPPWSAQAVTDRGLSVLSRLPDRGSFLWIHYVDPHLPYAHAASPLTAGLGDGRLRGGLILDEAGREEVREAYAREVEHLDLQLERLLDGLEARGWLETGWIVLTSDHGEELFDHGGAEHGHSHHGEVVDVGLVIVGPRLDAGPGSGVASLIDVTATLRGIAGLAPVGPGFDLRSPLPADRIATAYGNAYVGVARSARSGSLRVIVEPDGRVHAYDLAFDPAERSPLALPDDHRLIEAALGVQGPEQQEAADVNTEALKALGYLE